jgi:outer membrane protein assembly factor BamD (BamD/ComL family)
MSIVLIIIVIIGYISINPIVKYNSAQSCLENKEYDRAIKLFSNLGSYKDSEEKAQLSKYNKAKEALENNEYENAIEMLSEISDYKDSSDQIKECKYLFGIEKYDSGNFLEGKNLY